MRGWRRALLGAGVGLAQRPRKSTWHSQVTSRFTGNQEVMRVRNRVISRSSVQKTLVRFLFLTQSAREVGNGHQVACLKARRGRAIVLPGKLALVPDECGHDLLRSVL